jgi:hypothetical protein
MKNSAKLALKFSLGFLVILDLPLFFFSLGFNTRPINSQDILIALVYLIGFVVLQFAFIFLLAIISHPFVDSKHPIRNTGIFLLGLIVFLIFVAFVAAFYKVIVLHG